MDFLTMRRHMIDSQIKARGLTDPKLSEALAAIPREIFVPRRLRPHAYDDRALEIGERQTISQPYVVALMTSALGLQSHERVLEVGAGSGYGAAVLSKMASQVFAIELNPELFKTATENLKQVAINNVNLKLGDGNFGWPEMAPFDGISVTAGAVQVPPPLLNQLSIGGRLVIPVGPHSQSQNLIKITRTGPETYLKENLGQVAFVPFVNSEKWATQSPNATANAKNSLLL
jgi:protein-L-isoaspartate(D-aspartate) O-methyltransferase